MERELRGRAGPERHCARWCRLFLALGTIGAQCCRSIRPGAVPEQLKAAARPSRFSLPGTKNIFSMLKLLTLLIVYTKLTNNIYK